MEKVVRLVLLMVASFGLALLPSCGFLTGPDPAEKLAFALKKKTGELKRSEEPAIEFEFVPDTRKVEKVFGCNEMVTLEVLDRGDDASLITCNRWFWTTYHNRFIDVNREFAQSKRLGEPFRVTLRKTDGKIEWVGLD
jgi:hypothetical protein